MWIDDIETIRMVNNIRWMDILRIAYKHAPEETKAVMKKITEGDRKVSEITASI